MIEVASLVLHAEEPEETARFYRPIGFQIADEQHGDGPTHYACELGSIHFAIYAAEGRGSTAPARRAGGSTFPGFYVDDLDSVRAQLESHVRTDHEEMPWGCRIVFEDPDGRPIEINQRNHCTTPSAPQ